MATRVCATCDVDSLPRVGGAHVCPGLLFLHSCGRSAGGGGRHNATKEATHLNALNPGKKTPPQSPLTTASLQLRVSEGLPLRQRHTNSHQQCCLTVGSESTTCGEVRQASRVRKQESPRLVLKQRRGRAGSPWISGLCICTCVGRPPPREKTKIKITQKIVSYVAICVGKTRTNDGKKQQQLLLTLGYTARNRQLHHAGLSLASICTLGWSSRAH